MVLRIPRIAICSYSAVVCMTESQKAIKNGDEVSRGEALAATMMKEEEQAANMFTCVRPSILYLNTLKGSLAKRDGV